MMEKIAKKIFIKGHIIVKSGLHIGGTDNVLEIGGVKNPLIRIKKNGKSRPYIPGSSIKGKMRSLIEHLRGEYSKDLTPGQDKNHPTARIFGTAAGDDNKETSFHRPSRVVIGDAYLVDSQGIEPTEIKQENTISRVTAKANPRPLERVLPDSKFKFEFALDIFESDFHKDKQGDAFDTFQNDAQRIIGYLFIGMDLIEDNFLGGGGSRGSGKVAFEVTEISEKTSENYQRFEEATKITAEGASLRPKSQEEFNSLSDALKLSSVERPVKATSEA